MSSASDSDTDLGEDDSSTFNSSSDDDFDDDSEDDFGGNTASIPFNRSFSSGSEDERYIFQDDRSSSISKKGNIPPLTDFQKEKVTELKRARILTHEQIAMQVKCLTTQVSNFVKRAGLSPKTGDRIPKEKKRLVLEKLKG